MGVFYLWVYGRGAGREPAPPAEPENT